MFGLLVKHPVLVNIGINRIVRGNFHILASLGYVHINVFSFVFVFADVENAQRFSVDTYVFIPFSRGRYVSFSFGSTFWSLFTMMRFRLKCSAS